MPKEKIGSDVLGKKRALPRRPVPEELREKLKRLEEERKRRLEELGIREEEKRKIRLLEEEGKLPKLPIPGELPHEKKPGEAGYDKIIEEQERKRKAVEKGKTVHVQEHYRHPPGKAEAQSEEED